MVQLNIKVSVSHLTQKIYYERVMRWVIEPSIFESIWSLGSLLENYFFPLTNM